jgi:hypothetical protein
MEVKRGVGERPRKEIRYIGRWVYTNPLTASHSR